MYEAIQYKKDAGGKVSRHLETRKRQLMQFKDEREKPPTLLERPIQRFYVPEVLNDLIDDVTEVKDDIAQGGCEGDTKHYIMGTMEWADGTYDAATRKLNEWYGVKYLVETINPQYIQNICFGMDDVEQPDVYLVEDGAINGAIENKYVSGNYSQIIDNAKNAIEQLLTRERSAKYSGELTAMIVLSELTSQNLLENLIYFEDIIGKLVDFTRNLYQKGKVKVISDHVVKLIISNFPQPGETFTTRLI
uniref:hypothetical protein n=1 Tax=uncultured Bacteroides sp. TaxID=162156 RepID=UPI0025F3DF80|nr:hypothetical protein [uncultured Bacteroides sp.]